MRFKIGPGGALTKEREEPIAADARPEGDGKQIAKLKVVGRIDQVGNDIGMRQHYAFGLAGRTGGVNDRSQIVRRNLLRKFQKRPS